MNRTRYLVRTALIAAAYAAVTILAMQTMQMLAWGPVQFRVSEALTVIAVLTPAAIPGLTLGAVIANGYNVIVTGPAGLLDVVFGSIATLAGAAWTWRLRTRTALALAGPVVTNALIVPAYLPTLLAAAGVPLGDFYRIPVLGFEASATWLGMYVFGVISVGVGQAVVVYALGWPLLSALRGLEDSGVITGQ